MKQSRPTIHDWISLLALRAAKARRPKYTNINATSFYNQFFHKKHVESYSEDVRLVLRREQIQSCLKKLQASGVLLDAGCGVGDVLKVVGPAFQRVGLEFSVNSLFHAKRNLDASVDFVNGSILEIPFKPNSFDVVICLEVLEHLEDDKKAVLNLSRILKPGGYLIVSVPSHFYFDEYLELMGHWRHYDSSSFTELLSSCGLKVVGNLNRFPRFQKIYFYVYMLLRMTNAILNTVLAQQKSIYSRRLPFTRNPFYDFLTRILLKVAKIDDRSNVSQMKTSCFVVAQKQIGTRQTNC